MTFLYYRLRAFLNKYSFGRQTHDIIITGYSSDQLKQRTSLNI